MSDIIHLLPDNVANQIAAGEVVQRPASVVKELVENAIDSGASSIRVVIRDAGKTLIQVIDNGSGMSETDARMSFERHATSKIRKSEDLFHIVTKGFRGEALASIAAVAQVELRTRKTDQELGTLVSIEGSKVQSQEPVQCPAGCNFLVRNLFFNVPARRYFLKSDAIEFRHIIDEFQRVALTHPDVEFNLSNNGSEVFNLPRTTLRQRIVHVFGPKYNEKLVPVEESTEIVAVSGYVGKPDATRKTRGDQFFFVNNRFIRNGYLHHAVMNAFEGLLPQGHYPLYLIYLSIDPELIDINIHPTKTEIKFQDERAVYAILHAAVKRALGRHNIAPTLDFDQEGAMQISPLHSGIAVKQPEIQVNQSYNPFEPVREQKISHVGWFEPREKASPQGWEDMLLIQRQMDQTRTPGSESAAASFPKVSDDPLIIQMHRRYLMCESQDGFIVIDQQRAHQRVNFEKYMHQLSHGVGASQQLLFPERVELSTADVFLLSQKQQELRSLGFEVVFSGDHAVELLGIPVDIPVSGAEKLMEEFIGFLREDASGAMVGSHERMAWALALSTSIRYGQLLTLPEMKDLLHRLMRCEQPYFTVKNRPTLINLQTSFLDRQFQ